MSATAPRRKDWRPEAPRRKGWCPGALTPMQTGDGLLVRVRAPQGRLSLDQAAALADASTVCGNGALNLSARGNLHLRGLTARTLPQFEARLAEAGLLDADPEIERLRNIVVSPLDDIDPDAAFDLAPSVAALEAELGSDKGLHGLPAKFSFVLDALGRLPLGDIDADIRFEADRSAAGDRFAVFLAGDDAPRGGMRGGPNRRSGGAARPSFSAPRRRRAKARRGGCARLSRKPAQWPCSPRPVSRRKPASGRNAARPSAPCWGAMPMGLRPWSAPPPLSAASKRRNSMP